MRYFLNLIDTLPCPLIDTMSLESQLELSLIKLACDNHYYALKRFRIIDALFLISSPN